MHTDRIFPDILRDRRGTVPIDVMLVLPILAALLVLANHLGIVFDARNDLVVATRTAAFNRATNGTCVSLGDLKDYVGDVLSGRGVVCSRADEERGVQSDFRFWTRARRSTIAEPGLVRLLETPDPVNGHLATGIGYIVGQPKVGLGGTAHRFTYFVPSGDRWTVGERVWDDGYDPYLYRQLRRLGSHRLFPNVFPAVP